MTELRLETYNMPAAKLGGENPLPPLVSLLNASSYQRARYHGEKDAFVPPHQQMGLPYLLQDQYDRKLSPTDFKVAVLENEHLRAMFLLDLGGRMWSLFDKDKKRELLHKNPVFHPANLACRDAWFSGGVEWNISILAHSPNTCSPLFAARINSADGPVLRLYEWDRIRGVPWQIDFILPAKSKFLFVRPRINNPWDYDLPMYWWSNIAVDERPDTRILGPAHDAWRHSYDGQLITHPLPRFNDIDVSYPARRNHASDLYFNIPKGHRPWSAALGGDGFGLVHTSTDRLYGRKAFNWGRSPGGNHWQEFLSVPGEAYLEIQGGLTPTQGVYLRMPALAQWEWLEAYGGVQTDPKKTHGDDWSQALAELEGQLDKDLPRAAVDEMLARTASVADKAPEQIVHTGNGWGALERRRRIKCGQENRGPTAAAFPDSTLGAEQKPWLELLEKGALPKLAPTDAPLSPIVQQQWRELLENSAKTVAGDHWLTWYQLGCARYGAGELENARKAWQTSVERAPSPWALRNLAVLAVIEEKLDRAVELYAQAWKLRSDVLPLTIEYCRVLLLAGHHSEAIRFIDVLPAAFQQAGRIRLFRAQAALGCDDFAAVEKFFSEGQEVANIRERELSLSELWFEYHAKRLAKAENRPVDDSFRDRAREQFKPPLWIDFRMSAVDHTKTDKKPAKKPPQAAASK